MNEFFKCSIQIWAIITICCFTFILILGGIEGVLGVFLIQEIGPFGRLVVIRRDR